MDDIEKHIASYGDWRTERLNELRNLINQTYSDLVEGMKWGVPVWSKQGLVCAISGFKDHVKINFFKGAHLPDPANVFNSGLDSKDHRSINLGEFDPIDHEAISNLISAAVTLNTGK